MSPLRKLVEEIHRRSLWQVLGAYAVGAWLFLQVMDQLVQQLLLPSWAYRLALVMALAGLPVVLATAFLQEGLRTRTDRATDGVRALFTWRNALLGGVIGFAIWGLVSAAWLAFGRSSGPGAGDDSGVSASVIAVLPFSYQGSPELDYLGPGMVNLLGTKLDRAGDLRSVDARALLGYVERPTARVLDLESASEVAARFGAGRFVTGDIVEAGGRLQVTAALYDLNRTSGPRGTSSGSGSAEEVFELVDELAADLLAQFGEGPGARVRQIARVTTASLPAFKAYLEGESAFKDGRFGEAVDAFQRAVELDSMYALAFYRLSVAAEWDTRTELSQSAAEAALARSSRLSDRDRQLLDAHTAWRTGSYDEAEARYRSFVGFYPDDVEAWFQLAEVLFHANPIRGRAFTESREPFERVVSFEPDHTPALLHLVRIAARERQLDEVQSLAAHVLRLSPGTEREGEMRGLAAFARSNEAERERFLDWARGIDDVALVEAAWNVGAFNTDIAGFLRTAALLTDPSRAPEVRVRGHAWRAMALLGLGRWADTEQELEAIDALDPAEALELRILFALLPYAPVQHEELDRLRAELQGLPVARLPRSRNPSFFFSPHDELHGVIREYLLGRLAVKLGDREGALARADALEEIGSPSDAGTTPRNLAAEIRAEVLRSQGRPAEALAELDGAQVEIFYHLTMVSPYVGLVPTRFLRAELLGESGRHEEALAWYESLVQINPGEIPYLPLVHLRRAQSHVELRDTAAARDEYAAFLQLWADVDDSLRPHLQVAEARLAELGQGRR